MKRFIYKAKDNTGKEVTGEVEAQDTVTASRLIRNKGLVVISIRPKGQDITALLTSF